MSWFCKLGLPILVPKAGNDGAMIGGEAPVGEGQHVGFRTEPFASHPGAEKNVVNAAVGVFFAVIVGPGDRHGIEARIGRVGTVAVALRGAGVSEQETAAATDGPDGCRGFGVVE